MKGLKKSFSGCFWVAFLTVMLGDRLQSFLLKSCHGNTFMVYYPTHDHSPTHHPAYSTQNHRCLE